MRQWSVDASSDNAFSPFTPYSPLSQRATSQSLRSLPTNVERVLGRKPAVSPFSSSSSVFPSAAVERNASRDSGADNGSSFAFPPQPPPQHVRVHSRGLGNAGFSTERGHWSNEVERENEEEEILMGSTRSRLLPPAEDDDGDEDGSPRSVRLSRHIPQREGMDMSLSAFNLLESASLGGGASTPSPQEPSRSQQPYSVPMTTTTTTTTPSLLMGRRTSLSPGQQPPHRPAFVSSLLPTPSASTTASFTDSQVSDDSSYMTSLYNDMLADNLTRGGEGDQRDGTAPLLMGSDNGLLRPRGSDGSSSSNGRGSGEGGGTAGRARPQQRRGGLGGEVFRFGSGSTASPRGIGGDSGGTGSCPSSANRHQRQQSSGTPGSISGGGGGSVSLGPHARMPSRRRMGASGSGGGSHHTRVLCTNPERVLDAPEFPANNSAHLIDWGSNNKLIIGLKSSLYTWDGETGTASKMVDLQGGLQIDCVQWLHKCACVALSVGGGTVAIYDCRGEDFIRTVRLPTGNSVTGIAVNGPVMAVSSSGVAGLTQAFDLRAKNALVATYEGHTGPITAMQYCTAEPYYLATGGRDGHVRIWDSRRSQSLRYAYDAVHQGGVTALQWNPDRRSRLFTGGGDGVLCLIDTHAAARPVDDDEDGLGGGGGAEGSNSALLFGVRGGVGGGGSSAGEGGGGGGIGSSHFVSRAVKSMFPISGLVVQNGEVVTSHRGQGQLQLRKASSFQLLGVFSAPNCTQSLSCLTLSPDRQVVCAAQEDETLKFWRVFDAPPPAVSLGASDIASAGLTPSGGGGSSGRLRGVGLPIQHHRHNDPVSRLEEQLR